MVWDKLKKFGGDVLAVGTLGLAGNENTRAALPLGKVTGAKPDSQKRLEETQRRLAAEQEARMEQMRQAHLQNLANRLMAFSPMNNHLAERMGPGAAFSPEQMGQLAASPFGGPQASPELQHYMSLSPEQRKVAHTLIGRGSGQDTLQAWGLAGMSADQITALEQERAAFEQQRQQEERRRAMVSGAFQPPQQQQAPFQFAPPLQRR